VSCVGNTIQRHRHDWVKAYSGEIFGGKRRVMKKLGEGGIAGKEVETLATRKKVNLGEKQQERKREGGGGKYLG